MVTSERGAKRGYLRERMKEGLLEREDQGGVY